MVLVVVLYAIKYYAESYHDRKISSFAQSLADNRYWHILGWVDLAIEGLMISGVFWLLLPISWYVPILISVMIATEKVLVFNPAYAVKSGKEFLYISDYGFEGKAKDRVGQLGYYLINAIVFIMSIALILLF